MATIKAFKVNMIHSINELQNFVASAEARSEAEFLQKILSNSKTSYYKPDKSSIQEIKSQEPAYAV